jgi:hypothetical protein
MHHLKKDTRSSDTKIIYRLSLSIALLSSSHIVTQNKELCEPEARKIQKIMSTAGQPIKCKAMVARGPKQPMAEEEITVDAPKAGEVRVKVIANALCHTDIYTLDGHDPEGLFPVR